MAEKTQAEIEHEHLDAQERMLMLSDLADSADWDGYIERCRQADQVAPLMDPTSYHHKGGGRRLRALMDLAKAFRQVKKARAALMDVLGETGG